MTGALPPLRPDLAVEHGPPEWDGAPSWTLHDRIRNRFFRIGWIERAMLRAWSAGTPAAVATAAAAETGAAIAPDSVADFARFLIGNELVQASPPVPGRQAAWRQALHSYLFFRIPLGSPDRLVAAAVPVLVPLLRAPAVLVTLAAIALFGAVQTLRQWEVFAATLPPMSTPDGLALFGVMAALSGVVHEFGHAVAARAFGSRVGTVGIAVIVMVPTLYTEASDTWRLRSGRQRVAVGLAGIAAEILLAVFALAVWSLLPEGAGRSAAVTLATTALATTLAINLNPFLRFDGYFLLSDLWGVANLQERAFALFRWHLRRLLFGIAAPPPEALPPRLHVALTAWAAIAIPVRAVLYFGIAVLVYRSVFKLAGIALFAVEFGWFLVRPCWGEGRQWWALRGSMKPRRLALTLGSAACGLAALVLPWGGAVDLPAVIEAGRHARLFPPQSGRVAASHIVLGATVAEGEILLDLDAPDLQRRLADVDLRLGAAQWQVDHAMAQTAAGESIRVDEEALAALHRERAAVEGQLARLRIAAPHAGTVVERDPTVLPGRWLAASAAVAEVADLSSCRVVAYVDESDLAHLRVGAGGRFYADDLGAAPVAVTLARIDAVAARVLDDPLFAADRGGAIAVRRTERGASPAHAVFGARFDVVDATDCRQRRRGTVVVDANAASLAGSVLRQAIRLFNEESGL